MSSWEVARQLFIEGKLADVVHLIEPRERSGHISGDEAHYYGRALLGLGQAERAIPLLTRARSECSEPLWATLFLGKACFECGKSQQGMEALNSALDGAGRSSFYTESLYQEFAGILSKSQELAGWSASCISRMLLATVAQQNLAQSVAPLDVSASIREKIDNESPVTFACLDVLRPGDVAFDVGTNVGDIALIMSEIVGSRGSVFAIEPNPNTASIALRTFKDFNCTNVTLVQRAAAALSFQDAHLYLGSGVDDSLVPDANSERQSILVKTVALDDLIDYYRVQPRLIKMDVEDYEYEVLQGSARYIGNHKPILILEQRDSNGKCIDWLTDAGYHVYCAASYRRITGPADYTRPGEAHVRNIVGVHPAGTAHRGTAIESFHGFERLHVAHFLEDQFRKNDGVLQSPSFALEPGRHTVELRFEVTGNPELEVGILDASGKFIASYASVAWWVRGLPDMPFHIDQAGTFTVAIRARDGGPADDGIRPLEFSVFRVVGIPEFRSNMALVL
ncbi:FkbM family methyltransferase [Methylobacterium sp. 1030]|uniref:FkbM family methyltransferase n=1 Tax=Methylobacterium sp. 1030 TaxID=3156404 RepID=UPI0033919F22